ncbi:UDP-glucuronosyltransferase 2B31-like [Belonocnema kinseyi]|uniref:UDP-glucuronosyltransferase 2B31-like n=1 Tax=Belonocnema kinseyi TaxID=2817044 RepID=UPI00143CE7FF|nr:UDP-glucuronosyltransferase 2B31-like [Belonocnema kinseyi]
MPLFFGATCYLGLGHFLKVPIVGALSFLEPAWVSNSIGNPLSAAFFPSAVMDVMEMKTLSDRLKNSLLKFVSATIFTSQTEHLQTEAMRKYLSPEMPSIREIEKSVALLITNTHYSFFGVRPTTTALIEVGGLHISENEAEFTPELKQWMDESTSGVVYFTFGSTVLIESLPKYTILAIYASFSKIAPVRVLIKIKDIRTLPPGLPENVKTLSWIPQIPVLSHNNTRVFITHCGLLGLQESLHFGVPIIGIPLHSDQFRNVQIFVMKKMGIRINYEDISEDVLDDALDRILNNSTYREAAKYESRLFRDRPMTAMETATFWIEYVLRNGDKTLKSPALELKWWQVQLLDVYALLLSITLLVIYVIKIILKIVLRNLGLNKVGFLLMAFFSIRYKKPLVNEKLKDE